MALNAPTASIKLTLSFLSITLAWALMNIINSVYYASRYGMADDSGVVILWSGLFIVLAWLIFIIYPLNKLNHSRNIFKPKLFPFITAVYAALIYSIIVGGLFRSFELVVMFMPLALLTGLFFGLIYSLLIRSLWLTEFLRNPFAKVVAFLSPAIVLFFFLWLLPSIAPALMFRYMPDEIQDKIVARTIPKFKVDDDFEPLSESLPGYFVLFENGSGNMSATMKDFGFALQVHCGKIIRWNMENRSSIMTAPFMENFRKGHVRNYEIQIDTLLNKIV